MKHKRILLTPTPFHVDVFIGGEMETIEETLSELYSKPKHYFDMELEGNKQAMTAEIEEEGIIVVIRDFSDQVVSHEAVHVTWYLANLIEMDWDESSQELQAYYVDYIFQEIKKMME